MRSRIAAFLALLALCGQSLAAQLPDVGSIVTGQAALTVGAGSANVKLGSTDPVVQVYNPGTAVVYVKLGPPGVTAAATDAPVAPGSYAIFNTANGAATYLAAIAPSGTPTLTITTGNGSPLGWGGGGSSGGGSSAIATWANGTLGAMANYGTSPGAVLVPGVNAFITNTITCANCSGSGVSAVDEAAFTPATSLFAGTGGFFQTTATSNPLTTGQQGMFQVTANRALFTNLRNAAGTEIGTSGAPLRVDPTGTTTQPVSNASLPLPTGASTSALQTTGNTALTTINTTLGSPFQAGASIGNTGFNVTGTLPAFAVIPAFKIDQTTPGTTNAVVANAGTNLNTSALALETGGNLATLAGAISGAAYQTNVKQFGGTNVMTGVGSSAAGVPRVTVANDSNVLTTQSGTWTVQPGNTANSVPWLTTGTITASSGAFASGSLASGAGADGWDATQGAKADAAWTSGSGSAIAILKAIATNAAAPANIAASSTGGATPFHYLSAASTNATNIKTTAGTVYALSVVNTSATVYYLRMYDIATSAPTCSSPTGVVHNYPIPGATTGAGIAIPIGTMGENYANGIGFCLTSGFSDSDNGSAVTGIAINGSYK
jgi:hypothetical protein